MKYSAIHIRAISQQMLQPSIIKICLKITCLKFNSNFPGANGLSMLHRALKDHRHEGARGSVSARGTRRVAPSALVYPSGPWMPSIPQWQYIMLKCDDDMNYLVFTQGQFWPSGIVIACVCACVSVCVCVFVSLCVNHLFVRAITRDQFKLGSPNLKQRCKKPWLRSPMFLGMIDLDLQCQI